MSDIITIRDNGLIILHRTNGLKNAPKFTLDGDIVGKIDPAAFVDIKDAQKLAEYINSTLKVVRTP